MANYYADSSALVKRHIMEVGTTWIQALTDPASRNRIITAQVTQVEGLSALNRRRREGTLDIAEYVAIADDWVLLCMTEYKSIELSSTIIDFSRHLLEAYPLRAYDAVQLATAVLSARALTAAGHLPLTFLSADRNLLEAATAEGLVVDNPNWHP